MVAGAEQRQEVLALPLLLVVGGQDLEGLLPGALGDSLDANDQAGRFNVGLLFLGRLGRRLKALFEGRDAHGDIAKLKHILELELADGLLYRYAVNQRAARAAQIANDPTLRRGQHLGVGAGDRRIIQNDIAARLASDVEQVIRFPGQPFDLRTNAGKYDAPACHCVLLEKARVRQNKLRGRPNHYSSRENRVHVR